MGSGHWLINVISANENKWGLRDKTRLICSWKNIARQKDVLLAVINGCLWRLDLCGCKSDLKVLLCCSIIYCILASDNDIVSHVAARLSWGELLGDGKHLKQSGTLWQAECQWKVGFISIAILWPWTLLEEWARLPSNTSSSKLLSRGQAKWKWNVLQISLQLVFGFCSHLERYIMMRTGYWMLA